MCHRPPIVTRTDAPFPYTTFFLSRLAKPAKPSEVWLIVSNCHRIQHIRYRCAPYSIVMKLVETGSVGACRNSVPANTLMRYLASRHRRHTTIEIGRAHV